MQSKCIFSLSLFTALFLASFSSSLWAQGSAKLQGTISSQLSQEPIEGARLRLTTARSELYARSDEQGAFSFESLAAGDYVLAIRKERYADYRLNVQVREGELVELKIEMAQAEGIDMLNSEDLIPSISIPDNENDLNSGGQDISGLLTASRDVFISTASFVFGPLRYRIRGYDSDNTFVFLNGIPMNEMETGRAIWGVWGGLNDVMRSRSISVGVQATDYTFGAFGGATHVDTRASKQRAQTSISYASSNRSYRHRVMATHSTGMMANGWAFTGSASWRHANEGYLPGTYYSGLSYFFSADKKVSDKQLLSFTIFGAPTVRGGSSPVVQEMFDLTGSNYYNPNWGYQTGANGEQVMRNARMSISHQPTAILTNHLDIGEKGKLITAASFQYGNYGRTALNWYNARDPRPQYYRKLPTFIEDPEIAAQVADAYANDTRVSQIEWDGLYAANRNNFERVENANGTGDVVEGNRANYVIENRRTDNRRFNVNNIYEHHLNANLTLRAGLLYQYQLSRNYKILDDLLGADYYVDVDRFAERDSFGVNPEFAVNDLSRPNAIIQEGEVFEYNYDNIIHKGQFWAQAEGSYEQFDFFVSAEASTTQFWRNGKLRNGKFPESSAGRSETNSFFNYGAKGGLTYKIDGRNYAYASAMYQTRAPYFRNAYVSPRTRDQVVGNLGSEQNYGFEAGFIHQGPILKLRAVGYLTRFTNQTSVRSFFMDNAFTTEDGSVRAGFVNYIMTGVDQQHAGLELAAEVKLPKGFSVRGVAALGEYIYTSRPEVAVLFDNDPRIDIPKRTAYLKNFRIGGTPQTAFNLGLNYNAPSYWFVNLNFNYVMNNWVSVNPDRRTEAGLAYVNNPELSQDFVDPNSELWSSIIDQQRLPGAFTVDLFGGKSWRLQKGKYFLMFNLGVSNLLNNRNIIITGFEQLRFDYRNKDVNRFPAQFMYAFGTNFFTSLTLRF